MRDGILTELAAIRRAAADDGLADLAEAVDIAILMAAKAQLDAVCDAMGGGYVEGAGRDRGAAVTHPRFVGTWRRH